MNKRMYKNNFFKLLIENSDDLITVFDLKGKCLHYSGPNYFEITRDDIIGKTINDILPVENFSKGLNRFHITSDRRSLI